MTNSVVTGAQDVFTGTAGDDTFNAIANNLLVTGDVLAGEAGTGTDTVIFVIRSQMI